MNFSLKSKIISLALSAFIALVGVTSIKVGPSIAQFASQATYAGVSGGSANSQTITIPNAVSYNDLVGVQFSFLPGFSNSGPTQININGLGLKNVLKTSTSGPVALVGGEIIAGGSPQLILAQYDGTSVIILGNVNATSSSTIVTPQGYLTPCNFANSPSVTGCTANNLVPTGDVTNVSVLYYQTAFGTLVPVSNGSAFVPVPISELTLTLGSSNLANTLYDVCVTTITGSTYAQNGTPTLMTSVAWTTSTNGAGNRGSGAGTAQITKTNGIWVNAVSISAKNGASTYTVPAGQCTMLATILIGASNGQVSFTRTVGISRVWSAWNFYNRQQLSLTVSDPTASWTYGSTTYRPSRNQTTNSLIYLQGLQEEVVSVVNNQNATITGTASNQYNAFCGIGLNTAVTATVGYASAAIINTTATQNIGWTTACTYTALPTLGTSLFTSLEATLVTGTYTFLGTEANMRMTAQWKG